MHRPIPSLFSDSCVMLPYDGMSAHGAESRTDANDTGSPEKPRPFIGT